MLQGRTLTGPQVGRAAVLRPALFHRMPEFLEFYDALILPVAPVRAFDAESSTPTWSPGGNSRTLSAGWARSVTSPSPAIRRSACRPGSPPPARPLGCSSSDGTAGSATSLAWPRGSNRSRSTRRYTHVWTDLDGVRSRTGPNPRRLARVFTRAGPYATSDRERTHTEQMRTATDDFARPQGHVRQSPRERSCLLYTSPSPRDGLL